MLSLILLVCMAWMCSGDPSTVEEMEEIRKKCQEEHGITDEMFMELRKKEMILEDDADEPRKCIIECLLLGFGLIKEGEVDVTTVMNIAKPILENIEKDQGREIDEEGLKDDIFEMFSRVHRRCC
ncbi:hypothetical protein L9F63_021957 [Diploptera punctata]|uniref:Uncharacterized protein n=1 Tax=Diploptera punctata TaxID=6984 RepID=A0AAD7ZNP4_DIPPU|nr:hypothetical protein L9F63_021957 [Diploptera punctata]